MYVNKMLGILTDIIPNNCNDCCCSGIECKLPMSIKKDGILKKYTIKRHRDCPLIITEEI